MSIVNRNPTGLNMDVLQDNVAKAMGYVEYYRDNPRFIYANAISTIRGVVEAMHVLRTVTGPDDRVDPSKMIKDVNTLINTYRDTPCLTPTSIRHAIAVLLKFHFAEPYYDQDVDVAKESAKRKIVDLDDTSIPSWVIWKSEELYKIVEHIVLYDRTLVKELNRLGLERLSKLIFD